MHRPMCPIPSRLLVCASISLACALFASCSASKIGMMPTPLIHQYLGDDAFQGVAEDERTSDISIFYATNRPGNGPAGDRDYTNGIVDQLQLGEVDVKFGEHGMRWREVASLTARGADRGEIPLQLDGTRELDAIPDTDGKAFARAVNAKLDESRHPDITIYVHGAKSTFLRSTVQGAQFHHYMARHTALIAYSWPSSGRFLSYQKDVEYAAQSAPRLADLIEYLAANTNAERINILGYSAGSQVLAPGLAHLRERYRIGEVYFAASDVGLRKFVVDYLPTFVGMVRNVTVTLHKKDSVLRFAQGSHDGESRLGRPVGNELTPEEIGDLEELARATKLEVIDMEFTTAERPVNFKAHGHWYLNQWVSSDAILQFLFEASPERRGLKKKPGKESWYFPPDYPDHLQEIVRKARERRRSAEN